jgi:hypothetical protein
MTRINTSCTLDQHWIKANQDQVTSHPAWFGEVSELEASKLLEGKESFTYVLRSGGEEQTYFITFVKEDGLLKHQRFTLELDRKGWYYKNGMCPGPQEAVAENINELIPLMMHCSASECKIVD